jgi:alpha-glucosidase
VKSAQAARHVAAQLGRPDSVLEHYRAMIAFRKESAALRLGDCQFLETPEPILAFRRGQGETALICVFNLSAETATVELPNLGDATGITQDCTLTGNAIALGPNGFGFFRAKS